MRKRERKIKNQPNSDGFERSFGFRSPTNQYGVSVAVVYPGTRAEGMSSLAVHALVRLINAHTGAECIPIFALEKGRFRPGRSKNQTISSRFDLLAFTVSFEEQWVWIPKILRDFNIPTQKEHRQGSYPVVMVGGLAARLNPNPVWPFVDLVVPGEAEVVMDTILDVMDQNRGSSRKELLEQLGEIRGVTYTGSKNIHLEARLDDNRLPVSQVLFDPESTFHKMFLVETGRGCPVGCRFCAVSFSRRPAVFFSLDRIMEAVQEGIRRKMKIGLVGASLSRHPQLTELIDAMREVGADVSPASLHPDLFGTDTGKHLLEQLRRSGQRSVTMAPETGSERLRAVINKPLDRDALHLAVCRLAEAGMLHLKLYLMYGLPTEQPEDIQATVSMVSDVYRWLIDSQRSKAKVGRLSVSINPFVPKPHTPFEDLIMPPLGELRKIRTALFAGIKKNARVHISGISPKRAMFQWMLSFGGQEVSALLDRDDLSWPPPRTLISEMLPDYARVMYGKPQGHESVLKHPVEVGLRSGFVARERHKAELGITTRACHHSVCSACKGCLGLT